jgi:mono/diheme cytochrome c family protein
MIRRVWVALWATGWMAAQDPGLANRALAVLEQRCAACHSPSLSQSGLSLHSRADALKGGNRGPAIVAGQPAQSTLLDAIKRTGALAMPPGPKLPDAEIALLERWIAAGAEWPSTAAAAKAATWWSFQKPVRPSPPSLQDAWVRTTVDAFILRKLNDQKLTPAREAHKATLIRRAYLDLTGLAPTAEQVEKFVSDPAADAYDKLVDELLASPRYGEKWGRHWLDLVRYGDTSGFEQDPYMLYAWRYRDWVIDSFNNDKPYDVFVKEQLASDELYPDDPVAKTGGGYYTVGPNRDMLFKVEDINRQETLQDWVDTTGSVFLGLTVGCARCHDHKFDPIPQKDYLALQAIFMAAEKTRVFLQYDPARQYDLAEVGRNVRLYEIADQLTALLPKGPAKPADMKPEDAAKLKTIEQQLVQMFRNYKPGPFAPAVRDISRESPKVYLPARAGRPPQEVLPGYLTALGGGGIPEPPVDAESTGRRKALANWIATRDNPLTARVMVNRVWQYHFGTGIVATTSDFGHRGGAPSHPELLEWLATEFMENGWSVKKLHWLIMTSSVYRQGTEISRAAQDRDAANIYLSHFNRRRMLPEEIRDSMLQSSGALNLKMAGRPVVPEVAKEELFGLSGNNMWPVTTDVAEHSRRSVYMLVRRTFRPAMFESFDAPDGIMSCSRRAESNTAPQSLTLLNGHWTLQESNRLAEKLAALPEADAIKTAWRAVYARNPSPEEVRTSRTFLERQTSELGNRKAAAGELIRVLFNTNEFLYVD